MILAPLRILLIEDNPADIALIKIQIKKIAKHAEIYYTADFNRFVASLIDFEPDIIISDYRLNAFTGLDVMKHAHQTRPDLPFIFVTSAMQDEELAANTILNGASDYVLKNNMLQLHIKLLPHFEAIAAKKNLKQLPPGHREILDEIQLYLDNIDNENAAHLESFKQIKKELDKYKSQQQREKK